MCGICGVYNFKKDRQVSEEVLNNMNRLLLHRGPDDNGIHLEQFVGFGHTRLSIVDLSNGKQPMCNEDKTIWVTYNGEIYNYREIKRDLMGKGHKFITDCDTEVIVHSYEEYGTECVYRFNGMFSFAVWDAKKETLFLARDRMGVKPLYYSISGGTFVFASEIKAILEHPEVKKRVEVGSLPEYLFCTTMLGANTMFKDIYSVPAGNILIFNNNQKHMYTYWDIGLENASKDPLSFEEYKEEISSMLQESTRMRMISDVPLGSLLSGGLDSSLISALASGYSKERLKTFSMEYSKNAQLSKQNSDLEYSRMLADILKTDHKEFIFQPEDYYGILEKVTWHVEKPIELTTPSVYLLYGKLKRYVTVVLSGEGADELFGGYFFFLNGCSGNTLTEFPWAPYFKDVCMLLDPGVEKETRFREKISSVLHDSMSKFESNDYLNRVLYLFLKYYLLEMLERQDKTSMAWGVEARVPFLDYRLVDYVSSIPYKFKVKGDIEKFILKEVSKAFLPIEIVQRKKKPFPFPIDPKSIQTQKNTANELIQSGNSKISQYFDKKTTNDFFNKRNGFKNIDNLCIFRTSHALIALELWHKVFGV